MIDDVVDPVAELTAARSELAAALRGLIDTVKVIALGGAGGAFGDGLVAVAQQTAEAVFS